MWGLGCVLAELLYVVSIKQKKNNKDEQVGLDRILLPGGMCYPLSPGKMQKVDDSD